MNRNSKYREGSSSVSLSQLFRYASPLDNFLLIVGTIIAIITGAIAPIFPALVADALEFVLHKYPDKALQGVAIDATAKDIFTNFIYLGLFYFFLTYIYVLAFKLAALDQVHKIRTEYLKAILNQDSSFFDLYGTGDFPHDMISNMANFKQGIDESFGHIFYHLTALVVSCVVILVKSWKLALIFLSVLPVNIVIYKIMSMISDKMSQRQNILASQCADIFEEVLTEIRTVQAFSGQGKEYERYQLSVRKLKKYSVKKAFVISVFENLIYMIAWSGLVVAFCFAVLFYRDGTCNMTTILSVFVNVFNLVQDGLTINQPISFINDARAAAASIYQLVDNVPTINPLKNEGEPLQEVKGDIEFKNVFFHYPSRPDVTVLNGFNLTVKAGETVALTGQSGCGKSTILQLVSRYYDTIQGSVTLDGHDLKSLPVRWLREQIGFVAQEPVLFDTTVMENIRYGREDATRDDIIAAAQLANAHDFITKLTDGYDTLVGIGGSRISGGQKQRIAIARALVRNPKILLMDEGTSALDNVTEALVQDSLDQAKKGRATIMVSHRLTSVHNADLIYVIEKGNILEFGSPAELMEKQGMYYKMMIMQGLEPIRIYRPSRPLIHNYQQEKIEVEKLDNSIVMTDDYKNEMQITFCQILELIKRDWYIDGLIKLVQILTLIILFYIQYRVVLVLFYIKKVLSCTYRERLIERLKLTVFKKYLECDMEFFDNKKHSVGALCAKNSYNSDAMKYVSDIRNVFNLGLIACLLIGILIKLCFKYWQIVLGIVLFTPIMVLIKYYEGKLSYSTDTHTTLGLEDSSKLAVEIVSNYKTVASLVRESIFVKEYENFLKASDQAYVQEAFCISLLRATINSILCFIVALLFYYEAYVIHNNLGSEKALGRWQAYFIATSLYWIANSTLISAPNIQKGLIAYKSLVKETRRKVKIKDPDQSPTMFICDGSASFEYVKFKYPSRPLETVLDGLNLQIEQGKTTAIVGGSGCGKSAVIQLLLRFYDPDAGTVKQTGIPLPELCLDDFRKTIGWVDQEPTLFDRTIGDNIAYGLESDTDTERIHDAAQQANIHNFIISLPEGYDTNVGKNGTQLSSGQKQKIALARALVRQPKLLLLDEVTSNLDAESEKIVQKALDTAKAGRTCVIIAHRMNTIRNADVICVLFHGKLAEKGTHDQLMDLKGLYYELNNFD